MPKTRHLQFVDAFDEFMKQFDIEEYKLTITTENQVCRDHRYYLDIPLKIIFYTIQSDAHNDVVYQEQHRLTFDNLKSKMEECFYEFELVVKNVLMSFIKLDKLQKDIPYNDHTTCDRFIIDVYYYKSHLPFQIKRTIVEELEHNNNLLREQIEDLEDSIRISNFRFEEASLRADKIRRRFRTEQRNMQEKYSRIIDRMRQKLFNLYRDTNQQDECPVCFESIDSAKLKIPDCCHYICRACADKCNPKQCPICRESFI
jgi:hypothetical protein